jgi:hypothetical protein
MHNKLINQTQPNNAPEEAKSVLSFTARLRNGFRSRTIHHSRSILGSVSAYQAYSSYGITYVDLI